MKLFIFVFFLVAVCMIAHVEADSEEECDEDEDIECHDSEETEELLTTTEEPHQMDPTSSPSIEPTLMPTSIPTSDDMNVELRIIHFDENYGTFIGDRDALFLELCSEFWRNLRNPLQIDCVHVQSGSILLTLEGTIRNLNAAEAILEETGMSLSGFGLLQTNDDDGSSPGIETNMSTNSGNVTSEVWFFLILFTCGAGFAVLCAYVWRLKCFDDEEGFVAAEELPKLHIQHPPGLNTITKNSGGRQSGAQVRGHLGIAVRDGSNQFDVRESDKLGATPGDAPFKSLARDVGSFCEGGRPTGFSVEEQGFVRRGEPSIVDFDELDEKHIIDVSKETANILQSEKPTSGIFVVERDTPGSNEEEKETSRIIQHRFSSESSVAHESFHATL